MAFPDRQFEIRKGDHTWVIRTFQDAEISAGSAVVQLKGQTLSHHDLIEKLKEDGLGRLVDGVRGQTLLSNDSMSDVIFGVSVSATIDYGRIFGLAVTTKYRGKEVPFTMPDGEPVGGAKRGGRG